MIDRADNSHLVRSNFEACELTLRPVYTQYLECHVNAYIISDQLGLQLFFGVTRLL